MLLLYCYCIAVKLLNFRFHKYSCVRLPRVKKDLQNNKAITQQLIDNLEDVLFVISPDWQIVHYINPAYETLWGHRCEYLLRNPLSWVESIHPEDKDMVIQYIKEKSMGDMEEVTFPDYRIIRPDGSTKWISARCFPVFNDKGEVFRVAGIASDITERKKTEADLAQAKDAAQAANRAKANFLANMTHELRTPLTGVLGMNELLLDTPLSEHQRSLAVTVQRSAEALLDLVNDVLDFSKIESGLMQLNPVACMLNDTFKSVEELLTATASEKGLYLRFEIDPLARVSVFCDPKRLRQILINLIGNGIKFTQQGGVVVRVNIKHRENDAGHFVIEVEDTGIGITPEEQQDIFEPFVQVDSTSTRAFGGTGLGLTIVRELIEAMQGSLTVESRPGVGSLFTVKLDLPIVTMTESVRKPFREPSVEDEHQFTGRILVVDDNKTTLSLIRNLLIGTNLEIDLVSSAGDALQCVEKNQYQLILMDYSMPDADGVETTRQLRTRGFNAPIIAMTAHIDSRILESCTAAGMGDHLRKPFRRKDLFRILNMYLHKP